MDLKTFLAAIRLYWKTFVIVTAAVSALGLTWLLLTPVQYVSTAQLMVTIRGSTTAASYQNDDVVKSRVNSYIVLLTSDVASQRVVDKLGLAMTAQELAAKVSATNVPPNTSVIDIAVTDAAPEQARRIAETVATEFVSYTNALETPTGEDGQKVQTTVVSTASEPRSRGAERAFLGVLAVLAALLLASVAVWVRSLTDPVVRTADRAAAAAGVPVLGSVSSAPATSMRDLEGYRRLRTRLNSTSATVGGRVVEMAPVDDDIDSAVVMANLGRAMTLPGGRAIVLDATTRTSPSESTSGLVRGVGGAPDTYPVNEWAGKPARALTKQASRLVALVRRDYEHVLIAAPPALSTFTSSVLAEYADLVILLVSTQNTKRRSVRRAADSFEAAGAPLIGVVLVSTGGGVAHLVAEPLKPVIRDGAAHPGLDGGHRLESEGQPGAAITIRDRSP